MRKFLIKSIGVSFLVAFSFIVLQSYNQKSAEEPAVKCRKSTVKGDYCWTSGNAVTGCVNSTEKDDCENDAEETEILP